jgi:hypothetical protein
MGFPAHCIKGNELNLSLLPLSGAQELFQPQTILKEKPREIWAWILLLTRTLTHEEPWTNSSQDLKYSVKWEIERQGLSYQLIQQICVEQLWALFKNLDKISAVGEAYTYSKGDPDNEQENKGSAMIIKQDCVTVLRIYFRSWESSVRRGSELRQKGWYGDNLKPWEVWGGRASGQKND